MKTPFPDLFPETLLVTCEGDYIFTTTLRVAEHFNKRHTNVLRATEKLLSDLSSRLNFELAGGDATEFAALNFELETYLDAQKKPRPLYRLTHDGFALLVMGFTGPEALAWKIRFLAAFRAMEHQLQAREARFSRVLDQIRPSLRPVVEATERGLNRAAIAAPLGKSPAAVSYHRRQARRFGLLAP